jgi:uncharacterized protein
MISLIPLTDNYTIYQLKDYQKIPTSILESGFYSITKTSEEISIVTNCNEYFENFKSDNDWRGFKVEGILDFSLIGIINNITKPLKDFGISVFVISTFNTDYIFVKKEAFQDAIQILKMTDNININS